MSEDVGTNELPGTGMEPQEAAALPQGPGARLAAIRQSKGWSLEDVASQLNLAVRQVQAIENDDYAALPGMAITRGFMRAYAKLLKVDPTPLLAAIPGEPTAASDPLPKKASLDTPYVEPHFSSPLARKSLLKSRKAGVLLAAVVLAAVALSNHERLFSLPASVSAQIDEGLAFIKGPDRKQVNAIGPDNGSETSAGPSSDASAVAGHPSNAADNASTSTTPPAPAAPPADAVTAPAHPSAVSVPDDAAVSSGALVLRFREDSWVEIKRADNRYLLSRLAKAGSTETVRISEPVSVVIGNASGVDATWRGASLELKAGAKSNVARLNLK